MGLDALLKNKLGQGSTFKKLHIHSLSIPEHRNWAYFRCMGSGFRDNGWFSKLSYLPMKLGHWPKFQQWHIYSLSNPGARKWDHSHSTCFWDTGRFSKFSYLGMNSRGCTCTLFLPQRVEIELIFTLRAVVSEIRAHFQNCLNWAWNLASGQSSRSSTYTLFLP